MAETLLSLKPNLTHIDPNFDGYLLANDSFPTQKLALPTKARCSVPNPLNEFSLLHAKLYSNIDRLVVDQFSSDDHHILGYIPLQDGSVVGAQFDVESFQWGPSTSVLHTQAYYGSCFVESLKFVDEQHAVATNSLSQLQLFFTGNRQSIEQWTTVLQEDFSPPDSCPYIVVDVRKETKKDKFLFHILLQTIAKQESSATSPTRYVYPAHMNKLVYLTIQNINGQYNIAAKQETCCAGCLVLATFDQQVEQVIIVVEKGPNLQNPVLSQKEVQKTEKPQGTFTVGENFYFWTQSDEELTSYFKFTADVNQSDVKVDLVDEEFNLTLKEICLINAKLGGNASLKSVQWIDEDDVLVVTLAKSQASKWDIFLIGDSDGQYAETEAHIYNLLKGMSSNEKPTSSDVNPLFNLQQLETCDQTDNALFFYWLNTESLDVKQKADFTGNQILFTTQFSANAPKGFATRYDVDGIVWSFGEQEFKYQHTLNAFGYIQAGHEGSRFAGCSPDGKYATLVNGRNYAFVYFQNASLDKGSELRNRKTGRVSRTVAKQRIFTLAKSDPEYNIHVHDNEFIGFYAANNVLLLLTPNAVYALNLQIS